ncbi:MAG: tripartite tricarboxylate transporter substrate binding protein [Alphaproteobacteria bacterium]|nr:tripartite tricarboxylate transporter substrate binding protein [Alphaproteobacteria bacterium]
MRRVRSLTMAGLAVLTGAIACAPAMAQDSYPGKPVTIVVGFPPGGATDVMARLFADRMAEPLGQRVIVENRGGAGGTIAAAYVAKAPADGYTLMAGTVSTHGIAPNLYQNLPYDSLKAFQPVALMTIAPIVLVAHPSLGVSNVPDLVKLAKANPGKYNYATGGNGTHAHLATEMLKAQAGIDLVHVPYKGGGPALQGVIAGEVPLIVDNLQTALPHIQAGKVKALAVMSAKRSAALPDTQTMVDAGYKDFVTDSWTGIYAPVGTPAPVIAKLQQAAQIAMKDPAMSKRLADMFAEGIGAPGAELDKTTRMEFDRWGKMIRQLGLKAE